MRTIDLIVVWITVPSSSRGLVVMGFWLASSATPSKVMRLVVVRPWAMVSLATGCPLSVMARLTSMIVQRMVVVWAFVDGGRVGCGESVAVVWLADSSRVSRAAKFSSTVTCEPTVSASNCTERLAATSRRGQ